MLADRAYPAGSRPPLPGRAHVVRPGVAASVTLRRGAVDQGVVGVGFVQAPQQAGGTVGEQADHRGSVGMGGAGGDAEPGGDLREGVVPPRCVRPTSKWWTSPFMSGSRPRLTAYGSPHR